MIVQGGMGVRVSTAKLASTVANNGGWGTIASVGLEGKFTDEIRKAKKWTHGTVGVNIMVALTDYSELARIAERENVDFIASGAGLPLRLPEYAPTVPLVPIVSSLRAGRIILKKWRKYNRIPEAFIVEGSLAGGHLGCISGSLKDTVREVLKLGRPVIAAGGIWDNKDVKEFMDLGCSGVQLGTRFVMTDECEAHDNFKQAYIDANRTEIINSPVGMLGRIVPTKFKRKERVNCLRKCLKTCNPDTTPFCILKALWKAIDGRIDEGIVFAGSNVARIKKRTTVKELMQELRC